MADRKELADGGAGDSGDEEHGGGLESDEEDEGISKVRSPEADVDGGGAGGSVFHTWSGGGAGFCEAAAPAAAGRRAAAAAGRQLGQAHAGTRSLL
jgi:hypothetical protein